MTALIDFNGGLSQLADVLERSNAKADEREKQRWQNNYIKSIGLGDTMPPEPKSFVDRLIGGIGGISDKVQGAVAPAAPPEQVSPMSGAQPAAMSQPMAVPAGGHPRAQDLYQTLIAKGAHPKEAALLTAEAGAESNYNPNQIHDNGTGYGLWGHRNERWNAMAQYAGSKYPSMEKQAEFALQELRNRPEGKQVLAAQTPEELARAGMFFERPRGFTPQNPEGGHNWSGRLANVQRLFPGSANGSSGAPLDQFAGPGAPAMGQTPAAPAQQPATIGVDSMDKMRAMSTDQLAAIAQSKSYFAPVAKAMYEHKIKQMTAEQPAIVREYEYAMKQRAANGEASVPFEKWATDQKQAGATKITVGGPQIDMKGQTREAEKRGEADAKAYDEMAAAGRGAPMSMSKLSLLEKSLESINTGAFASAQAEIVRYAKAIGFENEDVKKLTGLNPNLPEAKQLSEKLINELTVGMIGQGKFPANNFSDADRIFLMKIFPSLSNEPDANRKAIEVQRRIHQRDMEKYQAWGEYSDAEEAAGRSPSFAKFDRQFEKSVKNTEIFKDLYPANASERAPSARQEGASRPIMPEVVGSANAAEAAKPIARGADRKPLPEGYTPALYIDDARKAVKKAPGAAKEIANELRARGFDPKDAGISE
jgi:hypothetical protein